MPVDDATTKELAPTGKLRVAVAVGPSASALWTVRDAATGKPKGVPVELGSAMAQKLGVPVELVEYGSSGDIVAARDKGAWDVTFVPVDDDRKKAIDFGAPYHLLQSTYLVAPGSAITRLAEVNRPQVRIGGVEGTATFRAAVRTAPDATAVTVKNSRRGGRADARRPARCDCAVAGVGRRAGRCAAGLARARGGIPQFHHRGGGAEEPAAALAFVTDFIEEAKAAGLVRRALDGMGLKSSQVAPAGMKA